jgi:hypothetical protein
MIEKGEQKLLNNLIGLLNYDKVIEHINKLIMWSLSFTIIKIEAVSISHKWSHETKPVVKYILVSFATIQEIKIVNLFELF